MAASSAEQMRAWSGPAVLSFGFRPFFLLGAIWAAVAMAFWIGIMSGRIALPTAFHPVDWHAHTFLMGYLGAVLAGFLLTAVPNWTGRLPVVGWRLGLLALLWGVGRVAVLISALLPGGLVMVLDLSFLVVLAGMLLREIVAGRNWRNLIVVAMVLALIAGGALFHWQAAQGGIAARGAGLRLMLAAAVMLISLIGGRIIPSFTRNWLVKAGRSERPVPPMARFDKVTLLLTLVALLLWVLWPEAQMTGMTLVFAGCAQAVRMGRWCGHHILSEPLVWVLHLAYGFVPLGALVLGLSILRPDMVDGAAGQHVWMAGAIGLMTLAVMTRATLGHTGCALTAGAGTTALFLALVGSVLLRLAAAVVPDISGALYAGSAALWCGSFLGFTLLYGPLLLCPRPAR